MSAGTHHKGLLSGTPAGEKVKITGVDGGMRVQARLIGMGLLAGVSVDVRRNDGHGPVLVALRHARIALGRAMAEKVHVEHPHTTHGLAAHPN